jgi:hypothetical protein
VFSIPVSVGGAPMNSGSLLLACLLKTFIVLKVNALIKKLQIKIAFIFKNKN